MSNSSSSKKSFPAHLTSHPDDNFDHQRQPNPHLKPGMEAMYARQHALKNKRMGAQPPPRTPQSEGKNYVDMLDMEYDTIEGQNFVVASFLSPEHGIQRRDEYLFSEFLEYNDFSTSYKVCSDYADFMAAKYGLDQDTMAADFKDFMETESARLKDVDITTKFNMFCKNNEKELQKKYERLNGRETAIRGFNVLGVVSSKEEAKQLVDATLAEHPHHLDISFGQVGKTLVWNPSNLIKREYMEPELNELMASRELKEARKTEAFLKRKNGLIQKTDAENRANAEKFGTKTTMELRADGRPVNTTRASCDDEGANFMAALDGNGLDTMLSDMSLNEFVAQAKNEGKGATCKPIDEETGEEAESADPMIEYIANLDKDKEESMEDDE